MEKFNFDRLNQQARFINQTLSNIKRKIKDHDIGNVDPTETLNTLDQQLSELEGKVDSLYDTVTQELSNIKEINCNLEDFLKDVNVKVRRLEDIAREHSRDVSLSRSPQNNQLTTGYLETPLSSGRNTNLKIKSFY